MARILIIDDEANIRKTLAEILIDEGYEALTAADSPAGLTLFREETPDVVLLDLQLPGLDGLAVLAEIKKLPIDCEVIMISGHGTISQAVSAVKQGAFHFLQKPLSLIEVKQNVRHALQTKLQRDEIKQYRSSTDEKYRMVGTSPALTMLREQIDKVAPTNGRVLITGESGSGKELVAFAIHRQSSRFTQPFITVNCAAIPQNLIESELFGHEKGAFTGAVALKKGKFEMAHGGTLLLDEIGDMDFNTQTKTLRAIQEGTFERVGGTKTITVDVRIVAATHRDLEQLMREGKFREDLFYRLNVIPLRVPSLEERLDDIEPLALHFLKRYCAESGMAGRLFTAEALALLKAQSFKGNIRELKNIVERIAILCSETAISAAGVASILQPGKTGSERQSDLFTMPRPLQEAQDLLEKTFIETQLQQNSWDMVKTAAILGIQRTNLHRKIRQLGIQKQPLSQQKPVHDV